MLGLLGEQARTDELKRGVADAGQAHATSTRDGLAAWVGRCVTVRAPA